MVAGVDEAGRGPLAGPLVVAAVVLPQRWRPRVPIDDSKQLTPAQREAAYGAVRRGALGWRVVVISPEEVDRVNILNATLQGMALVLANNAQFETWPEAVREVVAEGMAVATAAQRKLAQAEDADILGKLDPAENEIVRLTDAERAVFKSAVGPLLAEQRKILGDELFAHVE